MTQSIEWKYWNKSLLRRALATLLVGAMPLSGSAQTARELEVELRRCEDSLASWDRRMQAACHDLLVPSEPCENILIGLDYWESLRDASPIPPALSLKFIECKKKSSVATDQCQLSKTAGSSSAGRCQVAQREAQMCQRELSRLKAEYLYRPGAEPRGILKDEDIRQAAEAEESIKAIDSAYGTCRDNERKREAATNECLRLQPQVISVANACDDIKIKLADARQRGQHQSSDGRLSPPRAGSNTQATGAGSSVRPALLASPGPSTPDPRTALTGGEQSGYELPTIPEGRLTNIWVYCDPKRIKLGATPSCKAYAGIQNGGAYPPDISSRVMWVNNGRSSKAGAQTVTASIGWIRGSDVVWVEDAADVLPRPGSGGSAGPPPRPGPVAPTPAQGSSACLGWDYSPWTPCKGPGTPTGVAGECYGSQSRTSQGTPAGCSGTPPSPLQQRCVYAPKVPNQCG